MLRLGRRGIILSLFINGLNIALYLIILVAACLNIVEASVNFIILNGFAASFACLLIVSEIRLPQLTYEYFRFLCTYRGRGLTYLFFGCLVASRIPFNLYGGIIVVCMGIAFFMLSYVKLIPPLDGLILNYKKLDQWKEQKHFRVQLEAQRIFEQQLQQEQNLARMIPAHHPNSLTVHGHMVVSSPKQIRAFSAINAGSTQFSGAGVGPGVGGAGALAAMFSPPMSPSRRSPNYPLLPMQTQQQHQPRADQELQFPHHQLQSKLQGSTIDFATAQARASQECLSTVSGINSTMDRVAIGRGKGRVIQTRVPNDHQQPQQQPPKQPLQLDKNLPPITTSEFVGGFQALPDPANFMLSPPPTRRPSAAIDSEPGSPLQYLYVGGEEAAGPSYNSFAAVGSRGKAEWRDLGEDGILKSAPHPFDQGPPPQQHQQPSKLEQQHLPLRTSNKPTPPHDPFRKTSLSSATMNNSTLISNLASGAVAPPNGMQTNAIVKGLYQPPAPPNRKEHPHPLQQPQQQQQPYPSQTHHDPGIMPRSTGATDKSRRTSKVPMTATGQILSTIGGISGCYGIVGGVPGTAALVAPTSSASAPRALSLSLSSSRQELLSFHQHNHGDSPNANPQKAQKAQQQPHHQPQQPTEGGGSTLNNPSLQQQQQQQQSTPMSIAARFTQGTYYPPPPPNEPSNKPATTYSSSSTPSCRLQPSPPKQHLREIAKPYMPDIVLTLPTPAETSNSSRREEYFAM